MNIVALSGRLSRPPEEKTLASGSRMMSLQVTVEGVGEKARAESVPVAWFDPTSGALDLDQGDPVVVIGRVRRRFYRGTAGTQSRTEVVAERVVPAGRPAAVRTAMASAIERLAEGLDQPKPKARRK
ncbi:MAG TPA: single-stranded DNA-binding protein [Acidimicrobiales bacterium]|nr:single-stranded DNA-binding protein [Acidimicrobiales bacterium]